MNKKVLVVCRNFPYRIGGAELSLLNELNSLNSAVITLLYQEQSFLKLDLKCLNVEKEIVISDFFSFKFFNFFEFFCNYKKLNNKLNQIKPEFDLVITQGLWSSVAINYSKLEGVESRYYLRDETSINKFINYETGIKGFIRSVFNFFEFPFLKFYSKRNKQGLLDANVIYSNSNYIAKEVKRVFGVASEVKYPAIDTDVLKSSFSCCVTPEVKGVVMIGDTRIKGIDVFLSLAKKFPDELFYIFGKKSNFKTKLKNVRHMGWSSEPGFPYSLAKVILVPSLWDEAFGRVSIEAQSLDIPVIVSNKGGLPETVNNNINYIAENELEFYYKLKYMLN
jgi:glycosyltransferase involved in cell wall biosynthesis